MEDLIKALQILMKYKNEHFPTWCGHETFVVVGIEENEVSEEDKIELKKLSFTYNSEYEGFSSYRFGSC